MRAADEMAPLRVEGTVDVDGIMQSTAPLATMGEGLADAFDIGGI